MYIVHIVVGGLLSELYRRRKPKEKRERRNRKREREREIAKGYQTATNNGRCLSAMCVSPYSYILHTVGSWIYVYIQSYKYTQVYYYVQVYMLCVRDHRRQMYIELTAGNTYFAHDVQTINRYCASAAVKKKRNYLRRKG